MGLVLKSFVSYDEELEVDMVRDWKPVEVLEDRTDMVVGVSEQTGHKVLNILQFS